MITYWRSRDLFKAFFMNAFALIALGVKVAKTLDVEFDQYIDISAGLHIYERDWDKAYAFCGQSLEESEINGEDFWIDYENPLI